MKLMIWTADGNSYTVVLSRATDPASEWRELFHRSGEPYSKGWIRVQPETHEAYVAYDHVVRVELLP
jgi:hypothetical protein